jgi:hypothetical protein
LLINICGGLGTGKTLLAVIMLQNAKQKGYHIFSNIKVKNSRMVTLEDFLNMEFPEKSVILMDEVYILAESRLSHSATNLIISHLIFQSRKKGLHIITTSQLRRAVDVRLRDLADILIYASRDKGGFRYLVFVDNEIRTFILPYAIAKKYFQFYNTKEIVEDNIIKAKRKKLLEKLQKSKGKDNVDR